MQRGRVKPAQGLHLRRKPNGDKIGVLRHDEKFVILDEVPYFRVRTERGQVGYVHGDYVERTPAWGGARAPDSGELQQPEFETVHFVHECFTGEKVVVDRDFVSSLSRVGEFARECEVRVWVTSSLRSLARQVRGAIVKPATRSCHHVGHAVDMNLLHEGKLYNSKALRRANHKNLPESVIRFLNLVREDPGLRWGGDFRDEDPVHIDDDLFHRQESLFLAKLRSRVNRLNS